MDPDILPQPSELGAEIEPALVALQADVAAAERLVERLRATVRAWSKACKIGHVSNIERTSGTAVQLLGEIDAAVRGAHSAWSFDVQGYLEGPAWRREVINTSRERHALRVLDDEALGQLISAPVAVQSIPARGILRLGRSAWSAIRPSAVAAELKRLRDRLSDANSQELLDALQASCSRVPQQAAGRAFIRFRDAHELFCLAPGYKRENPRPVFGMAIYSLHRSGIQTTRSGQLVRWEWPAGNVREREIFSVRAEDGRELRFWGISFLTG